MSKPVLADIQPTASGNWNVGATWIRKVVPSATDNVTILSGHIVTVSAIEATCALLTINGSGRCTIGGVFTLPTRNIIFN